MIGECGECGDSSTLGLCKIFFEKMEKLFCTQLVENIHHIHQSNHCTRVRGWVTFTNIHHDVNGEISGNSGRCAEAQKMEQWINVEQGAMHDAGE